MFFSGAACKLGLAWLLSAVLAGLAQGSPLANRASSDDRLVFCHFMIGICADRNSADDYDADMQRAKEFGIDAFALNIGTDPYTDDQLNYAYESAARNGIKVFISFDFNWWSPADAGSVGRKISDYAGKSAQLYVDERPFASSFAGDGLDVGAMKDSAGVDVFFVPNFHPEQSSSDAIDGALNWMGWPSDGDNKAPDGGNEVTVQDGDVTYQNWLGGKPYLAPVSPWFFTHYGPEVDYSKNWVFPSDTLIWDRWNTVLEEGFPMIEIVTWNDYGESHYVGPLKSKHYDDGNSKWANDMPHDGWLLLSKPFIAAYKAKSTSVADYITSDQIVYWYRRTPRGLDCDATDTTAGRPANNDSGNYFMGRPDGWQTMEDEVFVVTLLTEDALLTVDSGGKKTTHKVAKGASLTTVAMGVGSQAFSLTRGETVVLEGTSLMEVEDVCPCGIYNFNAYVGSLPAGFSDPLGPDGLSSLTAGLHVTTCEARPSLGTVPITTGPVAGPTGTGDTPPTTTTAGNPPDTEPTPTGTCVKGSVAPGESGNLTGLCDFACHYDYCPPGPCVCTEYGDAVSPPPYTGTEGCPLPGEGDEYKGLCSFTCNHGYCPPGACSTSC